MRSGRRQGLRLSIGLAAAALALAGCGSIDLPGDGAIACTPRDGCPRGMACAGDGFCYRDLPQPGDAGGADGDPGADAGDPSLLLDVHFEGDPSSETGLDPAVAVQLNYVAGHTGQGMDATAPARLEYPPAALSGAAGTIELWIAPGWLSNDDLDHHFVTWGSTHGLLFFRDGNRNLRLIVNRFGSNANPPAETGAGLDFSYATAGTWYHVAATWSASEIAVYVNGSQVDRATSVTTLAGPASNVAIGSEAGGKNADAVLDDLRTYSVALTAEQIQARAAAGR